MMTERYSHPGEGERGPVELTTHLEDVAARATRIIPDDAETPFGSPFDEYVSRLALVHDFGKLTTSFQQHIDMLDGPPDGPTHHAPIGALLAYYVLDATGHDSEECLVGYVAVAKHHGELPDVAEFVYSKTNWAGRTDARNRTQRQIQEQAADIDTNASEIADEIIKRASGEQGAWKEFAQRIHDGTQFDVIKEQVATPMGLNPSDRALSQSFYPSLLTTWSGLVLADKTSAAGAPMEGLERDPLPRETLESYIADLQPADQVLSDREQSLNDDREKARKSVLTNVDEFVERPADVATLTLPTGMGKTLTGLNTALAIRDRTEKDRVIYALPFTSIIDQVADEVTSVFDADGTGGKLTIHHHLAETLTEIDDPDWEDTDRRARVEEMLGESWRTSLTITTFVQLFESLAGPKNTQSMKLPALYNSVVILDEPQGLPHDWWALVIRLVEILVEEYDASIIAMTATKPGLFEGQGYELVSDSKSYFERIERVEYLIHESVDAFPDAEDGPVGYRKAGTELVDALDETGSVLAVCNTIDSAKQLTECVEKSIQTIDIGTVLEKHLGNGDPPPSASAVADSVVRAGKTGLLHLTTRLRPRDRLTLIKTAKELTDRGHPLIVVSTQLIEAGVDISFANVYRDFAPMDSIVQAAGRCNRSFERDRGRVTVWWLDAPEGKETTPGEAVYNKWSGENSLLSLTDRAIETVRSNASIVPDATIAWEGVREYYDLLSERDPGKDSWVSLVDTAKAEQLGEKSLIEQRLAVDVVVCRTQTERDRIEQIGEAWREFAFGEVERLLNKTRQIQVSVPIYTEDSKEAKKVKELPRIHSESDVRWLDARKREYAPYFDATTGLHFADDTVERRFL